MHTQPSPLREYIPPTEQDLFHAGLHLEVQHIDAALKNLLLVRDGLVAREEEPAEGEHVYDGMTVPIQAVSAAIEKLKGMISKSRWEAGMSEQKTDPTRRAAADAFDLVESSGVMLDRALMRHTFDRGAVSARLKAVLAKPRLTAAERAHAEHLAKRVQEIAHREVRLARELTS